MPGNKSVVSAILSVILCLLVFVTAISAIALAILLPDNIAEAVAKADIAWVLNEFEGNSKDADIFDFSWRGAGSMDIDGLREFFARDTVRREISELVSSYTNAIAERDFSYRLTSRDLVDFQRAVSPDVEQVFGISFTEDDYNETLNKFGGSLLRGLSVGKVLGDAGIPLAAVCALLTIYPFLILCIFCVQMTINIFLLNIDRLKSVIFYTGIPLGLAGLVYICVGLLLGPGSGLLANSSIYPVIRAASGLSEILLIGGLVCIGFVIITTIAIVIINKKKQATPPKSSTGKGKKAAFFIGVAVNCAAVAACIMSAHLCLTGLQ